MNADRHAEQVEADLSMRQRTADFHRHHPEYRDGPPPHQWPALLQGLPDPIAAAFTPLIATATPKEGNTP